MILYLVSGVVTAGLLINKTLAKLIAVQEFLQIWYQPLLFLYIRLEYLLFSQGKHLPDIEVETRLTFALAWPLFLLSGG